ncbi:lytic transglycosylase domain-containing protein [Mesorhizobium sp. M4A.F.Ca.ET.022.05.2.1]|uniref:lytic transglycosylase domain-containing protein n=1 Tax=Mesorhizobium sp. M4A.F.Ca.ET.022.05.2.1 TaxID=2496653 RepID=UPI000FCC3887|nr:lytic transglycosylase domain-containing protein [Mesorhizobium sp. M4A.F.Ca.ET.022.05.2.1]RVC83454.1 lytic transglycosylase domain-containing protein [Mesorhizobium sp. M4A.F.Ca.ET.022.05.2.1]TIU42310.1 MAG: lytic transglycosylase domain-containing protein [Mesorhizobium sp.]TIW61375.1 MAG: lytic transglycosylase domain-containing protein [Mesorhizobium sp.]
MKNRIALALSLSAVMAPFGAHADNTSSTRIAAAFALPARLAVSTRSAAENGSPIGGGCAPTDRGRATALVRQIAEEEGFDPDLTEAVAWAESDMGGNQGPSRAGALGIMQLMPATASRLGVTDRCDAKANIRAGVRYLKALYDEFHDPLLMLAAYNAGEQNVYKAKGIPGNDETTKYVVKVLNRWKLGKLIKAPIPKHVDDHHAAATGAVDGVAWQDGHVIDFGN